MKPAELERAIEKREIPHLLFLYGEEGYLLERAVVAIRDAVVPPEARDFNYEVFYGKDISSQVLVDAARTFPVFTPLRMILVKDAQDISTPQAEGIRPYLKDAVSETILVFTADKIDLRKGFSQDFKKHGVLVEFKKLYENQIPPFVKDRAREAGKSFTDSALAIFCRRVGTNLQEIRGELEKLFTYLGDRTLVDVEDVNVVVSDTKVDSIFDLTNAMGKRNVDESIRLLGRLLRDGTAPILLLSMMTRHFRQLWVAKEIVGRGGGKGEVAQALRINPYFVDDLVSQAKHFESGFFRKIFYLFLESDLALKSTGAHPEVILERLILEIAGRGRR